MSFCVYFGSARDLTGGGQVASFKVNINFPRFQGDPTYVCQGRVKLFWKGVKSNC